VTGRWTGRGLCLTERVWSVFSVCACFSFLIGRVWSFRELTGLQPVAGTVASGQFCSASGRCFVVRCSGLTSAFGLLRDQRIRSYFARPVRATSVSGWCFVSVDTVRSVHPVSLTSASSQHDFGCFKFLTAIFEGVRL
jgi:hypothetical protein